MLLNHTIILLCISAFSVRPEKIGNTRVKRNLLKRGATLKTGNTYFGNKFYPNSKREWKPDFKAIREVETWKERDMATLKTVIPVYLTPVNETEMKLRERYFDRFDTSLTKTTDASIQETVLRSFALFNETNVNFFLINSTDAELKVQNNIPYIRISIKFPNDSIIEPAPERYPMEYEDRVYSMEWTWRCMASNFGAMLPRTDIAISSCLGALSENEEGGHNLDSGLIAGKLMNTLGFIYEFKTDETGHFIYSHEKNIFASLDDVLLQTPHDIGSIMNEDLRIFDPRNRQLSKLDVLEVNDAYPLNEFYPDCDVKEMQDSSTQAPSCVVKEIDGELCKYKGTTIKDTTPHGFGRTLCRDNFNNKTINNFYNSDDTSDIDVYFGEYHEGKRHGQGTQIHRNGTLSEGLWVNDTFDISFGNNFEGQINPRYCECPNGEPAYSEKCWSQGEIDCFRCDELYKLENGECVSEIVTWKERDPVSQKTKIPVFISTENITTKFSKAYYEKYHERHLKHERNHIELAREKARNVTENSVADIMRKAVLEAFDFYKNTNVEFYLVDSVESNEIPHIKMSFVIQTDNVPYIDMETGSVLYHDVNSGCKISNYGARLPSTDIGIGDCLLQDSSAKAIAHELMHALGFVYSIQFKFIEQNDTIFYDSTEPPGTRYFHPYQDSVYMPHDFGSIMHDYREVEMIPEFDFVATYFGRNNRLSELDILEINDAYPLNKYYDDCDTDKTSVEGACEIKTFVFETENCRYKGTTSQGVPHGYGRKVCKENFSSPIESENVDVYFGEFLNGNRHGHGTQIHRNGTISTGYWYNDNLDVTALYPVVERVIYPQNCECANGTPVFSDKCWVQGEQDCGDCHVGFKLENGVCVFDRGDYILKSEEVPKWVG